MARKQKTKASESSPASQKIDESALSKGELRKLNALRKSVGDKLGEEAFSKWFTKKEMTQGNEPMDKNAELIAETLMKLIEENKLRIPRGGYLVTRSRGRVIVERPVYH